MLDKTQDEIMEEWENVDFDKPLVSVRCITYNQERYIGQALDSFLLQKTDFCFEVIVHDDASTDNTAILIQEYADKYPLIVKPIYESENQYSKKDGSMSKIINSHIKGKYVAICEGDDYWIDEFKLQKQITFLESNPEYQMCFTNFNIYYENEGKFEYDLFTTKPEQFVSEYSLEDWIVNKGYVAPMTWVYKKTLGDSYQRLPSLDGSYVMFAHFLASTRVKCFRDETTAVYRWVSESASHSKNISNYYERVKNLLVIQKMLIERYGLQENLKRNVTESYYRRAYKLICLVDDKAELIEAKKYCKSLLHKMYFRVAAIVPVRKVLCFCWSRKKR